MTKFIFVRHGEPDYSATSDWINTPLGIHFSGLSDAGRAQIKSSCKELKKYDVDLIVSSPYTRTMQGASIMARELNADVVVEHDLHEWQSDLSYSITDKNVLLQLCQEHDRLNGIYPDGETRGWESTEMVRARVLKCLEKYKVYKCVVVSGHAMMMQAVFGMNEPIEYGGILELVL